MKSIVNFYILICIFLVIIFANLVKSVGIIHGKYTESIKEYHMSIPHKANPDGEFSTFHLPHFHDFDAKEFMNRKKRDVYDEDAVHYGVSVNDELHHIELWPNRDFLHPQAIIEKRDPTLPAHKQDVRGFKGKRMCYYTGKVRGLDNSRAALSTCDGLTGYIHLGDKMYFIEPIQSHSPNSKGHHLHIVYPAAHSEPTKHFCGVKNSFENWENIIKNRMREEYLNGNNLFKKRQATFEVVPKWMETMVVCDKKMIMKHKGKRDLEQWLLTLFGVVKSYYSDASMTGVLQPVIVRIILLEKEEEEIDLNIMQNCEKTLDNFCEWAENVQPKDVTHPNHFDVAVLLSDWDFCDNEGNCMTQGLAYTGGACSKKQNCQLNEDKGLETTIIVSHEQGHLLGMEHDGEPPVPCSNIDKTDNSYYVMSPEAYIYTIRWSPCSTASMRQLAEAHLLDCFNDEPTANEYPLGDAMPGVIYDVDEQCNMMLRDVNVSGACHKQANVNCSVTWCQENEGCFKWKQELADGTPCGENKWCFKGKCEEKGTRPSAVDGGWGEWGDWVKCTKSCGRGVQFRERLCDNPKPENHGKYCTGPAKEFRTCNPWDCPLDAPSFRETQCKEMFPKSAFVAQGMFKPEDLQGALFNPAAPCALDCALTNAQRAKVTNAIADGAKCEIGNPLKICVMGQCVEVSCDGKFGDSTAILDRCGICNGDGTMCKLVEGNDTSAYNGYRMVAVVPAGSKNFKFEEIEPNKNTIALGLPDNKTVYFNEKFKKKKTGVFPLGLKRQNFFLYTRKPGEGGTETESIIWDRNREDIGIYIGHRGKKYQKTVKWSWIELSDNPTREPKYRWEIADFKPCSVKCGGGTQEPIVRCYEDVAGKVGDSFCGNLEKPTGSGKKCNEKSCEAEWRVGQWGRCRACKKKGGVRVREVQCIKMNSKPGGDDILTEDSECSGPKPGTVQLCETNKKCGSRIRKASYVPAKFQDSVWRQMNKLHLIEKRGIPNPNVYLKGKAPTTTKRTTMFCWHPPPLNKSGHYPIAVDREYAGQKGNPVKADMKKISLNETQSENKIGGVEDKTIVMEGTTITVKDKPFPKRYNYTSIYKTATTIKGKK